MSFPLSHPNPLVAERISSQTESNKTPQSGVRSSSCARAG